MGILNFDGVYIDGEVNVLAAASDADSGSCGIDTEYIYISGGNVTASGGIVSATVGTEIPAHH